MSTDDLAVTPDEYDGPATITAGDAEIAVEVHLHSHFEPIDGHLHWIGRISASKELDEAVRGGGTVTLSVGTASAQGKLSDVDPWGRFRITGTGTPPIPG
ncbi:DUF4873 domain-containing protein [Nocardioides sp. AE5]|uniref:DUF4873 domain-containing protein n=1 Tax=Nocardioides sp. AE5 TaxID=2962573 RepID=UPI002881E64B|nr:DUF4873 domain-containing protein [Nocardioides sp. AE5]MDT0201820.1 DUF4873 domain-containing protein [Nocardioides sp. AE5]